MSSTKQCFICSSTETYKPKNRNSDHWYIYKGSRICAKCYWKQRRRDKGLFQDYKTKIGLRKCSRCETDKTQVTMTKTGYPHRKWVSDGNGGYLCHNCTKKVLYVEREHEYTLKRLRTSNPRILWAQMSHRNHRHNGFNMILTMREIEEMALKTDTCSICDVTLTWGYLNGKFQRNTPSLDRINNEKSITKDNIQIICLFCNRTKITRTMKEFIDYCKHVAAKY